MLWEMWHIVTKCWHQSGDKEKLRWAKHLMLFLWFSLQIKWVLLFSAHLQPATCSASGEVAWVSAPLLSPCLCSSHNLWKFFFLLNFVKLVILLMCAIVLIQTDAAAMSVAQRFVIKLAQCFLSRINTNCQPANPLVFLRQLPFLMSNTPPSYSVNDIIPAWSTTNLWQQLSWRKLHLVGWR